MKILIEDQEYQVSDVKEILEGIMPLENKGVVRLRYVGYLYNRDISGRYFIDICHATLLTLKRWPVMMV